MDVTATLIVQILTFAALVWFVQHFLWGPLSTVMDGRQKKIADGLAAGERGKHEKVLAEKRAKEILVEAKDQAHEVIGQAQQRSSEIIEEAKDNAKKESERLIAGANAELEQEVARAKQHLKEQVSTLAIAGAEKIISKEINLEDHKTMLTSLSNELEAG